MKMRPKFRLAFLLIGMVPLLVTVGIVYFMASSLLREKSIDHLRTVASLKADHIESVLDRDLERMHLLNSRTQMRVSLAKYLGEPLEEYRERIVRIIDDALGSIEDFESISIASPDGVIIASTDPRRQGPSIAGQTYFERGKVGGSADTFIVDGAGELKIVLAAPLILDGAQLGVSVVESRGSAIATAVASTEGLGQTGETMIGTEADGRAILLAHPRLAGDRLSAGGESAEILRALTGNGQELDEFVDYRGEKVFAATRQLGERGLVLVVKIDQAEALAPMRALRTVSLAVGGVLLAAILIASLWMARSIARPLSALGEAATQLSEGDLSIRAPVRGKDEAAELSVVFNRMADRLGEARFELEQRVEERTQELSESRERFELAVSGTADGIWDWDIGKGEVFFSDRFKELIGRAPDEMENRYDAWEVLLHPGDRAKTLDAIRGHLEKGAPYDVEYRLACADGEYRWFRARGKAVRNEAGDAVRMAGSISDIEDYRRAVEGLVQSNNDLEQFAYVASHDLKEPLRMVASYVQLLDRRYADQLDDTAREFIGYATEGARRMRQLIDDLLIYARIGTRGKAPKPVESEKAFTAAVSDLEIAIRESSAIVTHGDLPEVMADPIQVTQLFQNLLSNAIKFRRDDCAPEIRVTAEEADGEWTFSIADNGIGIAEEFQGKIFDIFQRLHSREQFSGTGIGLAVCAKIVGRHGGRIWVESEPGAGSTFYFTLRAVVDLGSSI